MSKSKAGQKRKKKTAGDHILNVLLIILLMVALVSGGYLVRYYYIAQNAQNNFQNLKKLVQEDEGDENAKVTVPDKKTTEKTILKKFQKLYEKNNDLAGWLTIDDTTIDYPVMYTPEDNEHYLHLDFDGNWSDPGTPFIDKNCRPFEDRTTNVLIYGHNMKSGIMFRELLQYEDEKFYKNHKYIEFDTLYETGRYEVIAAFRSQIYPEGDTEHYHYYEFFDASDKEDFDDYVNFAKQNTPYSINTKAEYGDELITLSTCASHVTDGRFVIVAKKADDDSGKE